MDHCPCRIEKQNVKFLREALPDIVGSPIINGVALPNNDPASDIVLLF